MKILHLSDTHLIGEDDRSLYGIDPAFRLKKAFESMKKNHNDASFVVISGDLSDKGDMDAYERLSWEIKECGFKVYPIVGNHDDRKKLKKFFPQFFYEDFMQYIVEKGDKTFFFLDTLIENRPYGGLCDSRYEWFEKNLKIQKSKDIYIFMHHHPVKVGLYEMDHFANFRSSEKFWNILKRYENIKHITFGHIHRIFHGVKNGISFHSTRSSAFEVALTPHLKEEFLTNEEKPTYAILDIDKECISIHHHEYLNEDEIYKGYY